MNRFVPPGLTKFRHWIVASVILLAAIILSLGAAPNALAATAAGTVIGNQATASYLDSTGTARNTSSNLVQTTVSQVKSFTLTANGAKTAAPGQTVYYPHTITNTGNGTDTYTLTAATAAGAVTQTSLVYYIDANSDGVPDNFTPITTTGPLPTGSQFSFVVAGVVPSGATAAQTGTITVGASDTGANSATNTDTTTVANSVINVTKSLSSTSGAAGATLTVTLSYINSGTVAAANLTLTDALPSGMAYQAASGKWSGSATALTDATGAGDPAGIDYSVTGSTVTAIVASVPAGASGTLKFDVKIGAGLAPTVPATASLTTNTATYTTTTQVTPANTNSVTYTVRQTAAVVASGNSLTSTDSTPAAIASAGQGATVTFTNYVWNTGNGTDTFNVTLSPTAAFPAGTTFALFQADGVTSLLDSNGDGVPDTGPLAVGTKFTVVIRAYLPSNAPTGAGPYTERLTATSVFDPTKSDPVDNTLTTIAANTVDLTNGGALGAGVGTGTVIVTNSVTPNSTSSIQATFQLVVNNTSPVTDSYNMSVTSAIPSGWSVTFAADGGAGNCSTTGTVVTSTSTIAAGGNQLICAMVTVPAANTGNAAAGNQNFTFKAQSAINAGVADTIVDRVTVGTLHSLTLTPNGAQQTFPGGAVTYSHTLSNNGNTSETAAFPAGFLSDSQAAAGWTSALYIDNNGNNALDVGTDILVTTATTKTLAANASVTVFVRVFAPGSATSTSPSDVATVTATYNVGALSVSANDTTSVTDGLLLQKDQQSVGCAAAPVVGSYSAAAIPAGAATAPGQCIAYRITATNTTASSINTVVVSDIVPANTTRNDGCGAPAATGGATVGGTAAAGTGGTVTATAATLASTASFQLTFCARINP